MSVAAKIFRSMGDVGRIIRAAGYSVAGLRAAIKKESAFRQELMLFAILAPLGFWLGENGIERVLLIGSLMIVLIVELLNSAIEAAIDRIGKKRHKLSGRAKDMGSAAQLVTLTAMAAIWALVLTGQ